MYDEKMNESIRVFAKAQNDSKYYFCSNSNIKK